MLEFQLLDTNPLARMGITCKLDGASVDIVSDFTKLDFCFCSFECSEPLIQFAGTNEREKDYFTLYHKSKDETAAVSYSINDLPMIEAYGRNIPNGFEVDFTKVASQLGFGDYTLKKEVEEFGQTFTESWGKFRVAPFSEIRADETVKIEAYQTGSFDNGFDFENENVKFSIRIPAILTNKTPVYETLDTPDANWKDIQIHDRFWNEYDLIFDSNKYNFVKLILENMVFGSELFVSDYNLLNQTTSVPFNRIPLRIIETDADHIKKSNTTSYVVKLRDAIRNGIKRPYNEC